MIRGSLRIRTELKIKGLIIEPLILAPRVSGIATWKVECDDLNFISQFEVEMHGTAHEVISIAEELHKYALSVSEGLYGILGGETQTTEQSLRNDQGTVIAALAGIAATTSVGRVTMTVTPQPEEVAKYLSVQLDPVALAMLELYRNIMNTTDPISQFLGCYQLLDMAINANQDAIDNHVLKMRPETYVTPKPPGRNRGNPGETIYTRLRNELMHIRSDAGRPRVSSTRQEVKGCLDDFRNIVLCTLQQRIRQSA